MAAMATAHDRIPMTAAFVGARIFNPAAADTKATGGTADAPAVILGATAAGFLRAAARIDQ